MTTHNRKIWTSKELKEFKVIIIAKRKEVIEDLKQSKKRADDARNNNSVNAVNQWEIVKIH